MPQLTDTYEQLNGTYATYTWTTPTFGFDSDNPKVRSAFSEIPGLLWKGIGGHLFSIEYDARQDWYSITKQSNRKDINVSVGDEYLRWNQRKRLNNHDKISIDFVRGGKPDNFAVLMFFQDPKPQAVYHTYPEEESDWDILGLVKDSSIQDLKKQHQIMSRVFHPDKYKQNNFSDANQKKAVEIFQRINQAYENLKAILKKRAIAANPKITEEELSKYAVRFGTSNPFIV